MIHATTTMHASETDFGCTILSCRIDYDDMAVIMHLRLKVLKDNIVDEVSIYFFLNSGNLDNPSSYGYTLDWAR